MSNIGVYTKDLLDIGNLLQPKPAGKTQPNIGMCSNTGVDIGTLYETHNIFSPIGTFTTATSGAYTIFTFTGNGSIISSNGSNQTITVYYLIVGGGGAGGFNIGGGGGGGGLLQGSFTMSTSDLITVTVGSGGISGTTVAAIEANGKGGNSSIIFSTNTANNQIAIGGGYGGSPVTPGDGGSSGGVGFGPLTNNSNPITGQGNKGGSSSSVASAGGGGGSSAVGSDGSTAGGAGGAGIVSTIPLGISTLYSTRQWGGGGGGGGRIGTLTFGPTNQFVFQTPNAQSTRNSETYEYPSRRYRVTFSGNTTRYQSISITTAGNTQLYYFPSNGGTALPSGNINVTNNSNFDPGIKVSYAISQYLTVQTSYNITITISDPTGVDTRGTAGNGGIGGGGGGGSNTNGTGGAGLNNGSAGASNGGNGGANTGGGGGGGGSGVIGGNGGSGIVVLAVSTSILA